MHVISREIPYKLFLFRAGKTLAILQKNNFQFKIDRLQIIVVAKKYLRVPTVHQ